MSFLKSVWADLVEKRLWPVALVLLLALIAVPVLLGPGDGAATAADVGTTGGAGAPEQPALVSLEADTPLRADRRGKLRDPFKQDALPKVSGPTGATGASGPSGTAASGSDSGAGAAAGARDPGVGTTGAQGGTTGRQGSSEPKAPTADPRDSYAAVLRFGTTGSKRPQRSVQRLTPLPSAENPDFVYLGVTKVGKVIFLLSEEVTATGDGTCKPSKASCESVELAPGDTEFLEVTDDAGKVTQYQLDVKRIDKGATLAPATSTQCSTASCRNALSKAQSYLSSGAFSESGLVKQLEYEKFSLADARWAVAHVQVSWNAQAVKKAKSYLSSMSFSRQGLRDQLEFDGFTPSQAAYGVEKVYR